MIGFFEIGYADQLAIGGIAPAMIGAGEDWGIALIVAADLHALMPTGVQEHVDRLLPVPAQEHRFLPHTRHKVVPGFGNLAFMADEQPGAREDPLHLLLVDVFIDEDFTADLPSRHVHQTVLITTLPDAAMAPSSLEKNVRFFASKTFWSRMTFRWVIFHCPFTRRRTSRFPTRMSVSVCTRLR